LCTTSRWSHTLTAYESHAENRLTVHLSQEIAPDTSAGWRQLSLSRSLPLTRGLSLQGTRHVGKARASRGSGWDAQLADGLLAKLVDQHLLPRRKDVDAAQLVVEFAQGDRMTLQACSCANATGVSRPYSQYGPCGKIQLGYWVTDNQAGASRQEQGRNLRLRRPPGAIATSGSKSGSLSNLSGKSCRVCRQLWSLPEQSRSVRQGW